MPVNVGDLLRDTQGLNAEAFGAYHAILYALWGSHGVLPMHAETLARIARVKPTRWPAVWEKLARYFEIEGDQISQKRVSKTLEKVAQKVAKNQENGSKGGKAKALKEKETALANATANADPETRQSKSKTNSTNVESSEEAKASSGASAPETLSDAEYLWKVGATWLEARGHKHARSFLGRHRKKIDDGALCRIIDMAISTNPGDALEYIAKAVSGYQAPAVDIGASPQFELVLVDGKPVKRPIDRRAA